MMKNLLISSIICIICKSVCAQVDIIKVRKPEPEKIYGISEQLPSFKGGMSAYQAFLRANIQVPKEALDNGIVGKVFATYVVFENGDIGDIKILKGLGYGCDEEVIRMIKLMKGRWDPGSQKCTFCLPVTFH